MSETRDLLVEIGTEELPPKALRRLSESLGEALVRGLDEAELGHGDFTLYATPRRLAVLVKDVQAQQADKAVERRGPALQAAFDDEGRPTKAAEGFARSCGTEVDRLEKLETEKGAWLIYRTMEEGQASAVLIPDIVRRALDALPIPKRMRWGALEAEFVRPVHWVVLLFGDEVIETEVLSVTSGRETRGHRFHHPGAIYIPEPSEYEVLLESEGKVIAHFQRRLQTIKAEVEAAAHDTGGRAVVEDALLEEVTAMVEWPVAVLGNFEARFLEVPQEALISTMSANQKYFHVVDKGGQLLPHFITVSNIESKDVDKVREGNERVIRPRFADAQFFWEQDRKQSLGSRVEALRSVIFQKKLGTLFDKTQRIIRLASDIAEGIGADRLQAMRSAELCKCDLMTEMVGEFPELQGVMGRYYAHHDGESDEVAQAIDEHYMPRFAGDDIPQSGCGQAVALADRVDTLVGIFAIGQAPTGDKDPFALRRAALGLLRILIERQLPLDLYGLLEEAAKHFPAGLKAQQAVEPCFEFILERLRVYYSSQAIAHDVFESVRVQRPTRPADFDARIKAVSEFQKQAAAQSLAAANKRISNILKKTDETIPENFDPKVLDAGAEKKLAAHLQQLAGKVRPLIDNGEYTRVLRELAGLREDVDTFFDEVMVMTDDASQRRNRLALLQNMRQLFLQVADISQLQTGG